MRYLTAGLLGAAFALGSVSAYAGSGCSGMYETASQPSTVASVDQGSPSSTKTPVPATPPKSGG